MGESRTTLGIGPLNQCGQAFYWAEAVRRNLDVEALSFAPSSRLARRVIPGAELQGRAHLSIPHAKLSLPAYRDRQLRRLASRLTHVLAESFVSTPRLRTDAVVAHGSEIRDPDRHLDRLRFSYFKEGDAQWVDRLRQLTRANQSLVHEQPVFVSTPDLLLDVPDAEWLPLCIDVEAWTCPRAVLEAPVPTVLHVPSRRNPPIKGTQYVDQVLTRLDEAGKVRYVSPHGLPHHRMKALIQSADVVIDQILTGSYGVAAVEAMAAGRVVVGHVASDVRALISDPVPIVDATPDDLEERVVQVIEDVHMSRALAGQGVDYARTWHSGAASAAALKRFVESPTPGV